MKPRLLDLFCKAGGCAKGYQRAGFRVVGVDIEPQPNYCGDEFVQANALDVLAEIVAGAQWFSCGTDVERIVSLAFDVVHASPPCQRWSRTQRLQGREHPDLLTPTRELLRATGLPYVIENVPEAPLLAPIVLCGTSFGLKADGFELRRHRAFESNVPLMALECAHELPAAPIFGHGPNTWFTRKYGRGFSNELRRRIMGTPWIAWDEIGEAIPPAFTEFIGMQVLDQLEDPDDMEWLPRRWSYAR